MAGKEYAGAVVVVTGSSRGIGMSLAGHFLDQGARVIGLTRKPTTIVHKSYTHHVCDVRDEKAVRATFRRIGKDSTVDILVNNAGVLDSQHSFMLTAASARDMLLTNVLGSFLASREAAKLMRARSVGRIINIGSMAAIVEHTGDSIYAASKAGLATMTSVLAREFAPYNITCNTVGITAIESGMLRQLPRDKVDAVIADLPMPRYATDLDVFNVVDFLASARSSYITGQTIYLGGVHG
jgi:3-oxoacyl-[acyl-carrier protein] reductase